MNFWKFDDNDLRERYKEVIDEVFSFYTRNLKLVLTVIILDSLD